MGNLNDDVRERCVRGDSSAPSNGGRPSNLRPIDQAGAAPVALRVAYIVQSRDTIGRTIERSIAAPWAGPKSYACATGGRSGKSPRRRPLDGDSLLDGDCSDDSDPTLTRPLRTTFQGPRRVFREVREDRLPGDQGAASPS